MTKKQPLKLFSREQPVAYFSAEFAVDNSLPIYAGGLGVLAGDILADASLRRALGSGYALVLANIVSDVIIPLSAGVRQFMAPDAVFICSGIIEHRCLETEAALRANGFTILDHLTEDEWHCFVCK